MNKLSKRFKIKFGVIGCGRIAQSVHLPLLSKMQNVEVEALADIDEQTLQLAGRLCPSAKKIHDYLELISTKGIDSVIMCVPGGRRKCSASDVWVICDGLPGDCADLFGTGEAKPVRSGQPVYDPKFFIDQQEKIVHSDDKV